MEMLFNPTNCHVTVNGHWLNDAVSISYQQQASHEPLFGYMDTRFRAVAKAAGLVAGTIGIYFHEHDKFFRYMNTRPGTVGADVAAGRFANFRAAAEKSLRNQEDAADLINFAGSLDLNSEEYKQLADVAFNIAALENPDPPADLPEPVRDSDVIGDAGFRAVSQFSPLDEYGQPIPGAEIEIYYGDAVAEREYEVIHGVYITGRAKSPLENRAGISGEPVMEYYSFIGSHINNKPSNYLDVRTG